MTDDDTSELKAQIDALSPMGVRFVARLVDALATPATATAGNTWLTSNPEWIEYFGLVLTAHHGATNEPLGLTSYEVGFRSACEAVGWELSPPGAMTERFVDVTVTTPDKTTRKLSLKSTAAQRLSAKSISISKLTEAAWIQDQRSARTRRDATLKLFRDYRQAVDSILMLRAFRADRAAVPTRYELVEIPADIFGSLEKTNVTDFAADGPTVNVAYNGVDAAARVLLDRSDAKITIKSIQLSVCTVHAEWELTIKPPASTAE